MRIREIFVASLLTVTFGCPGDDSGDTDANTTPGTTTETPGTTTETPGTTTDTPADSSTSAPGDSTTGGGMGFDCEGFCSTYFMNCGGDEANDYGDEAGCIAACGGFDQKTFECKEYHAGVAADDPVHCSHSNLDGGGVCPMS